MKDNKQQNTLIINDLETLKVVADPLRAQILEVLTRQPLNVRQVASRLGLAPSKLYYHFSLLEKHGLIRVVETRVVANIIEKQYQATAASLDVDPELLSFSSHAGKENIQSVLTAVIDATREDILRSMQARDFDLERGAEVKPRRAIITREISRLPEERAAQFQERLKQLVQEFEEADVPPGGEADDLQTFALTVALYPSFYFHDFPEETSPGEGGQEG